MQQNQKSNLKKTNSERYKMENKKVKKSPKVSNKMKSVRLNMDTFKKAISILEAANKKNLGRKIKIDPLLNKALDLVAENHIKELQTQSLTNSDRQEILRKKYSELFGSVTVEEFIGITMTPAYFDFLKEHGDVINVA